MNLPGISAKGASAAISIYSDDCTLSQKKTKTKQKKTNQKNPQNSHHKPKPKTIKQNHRQKKEEEALCGLAVGEVVASLSALCSQE